MSFKCILNIGGTPQVQVYQCLICIRMFSSWILVWSRFEGGHLSLFSLAVHQSNFSGRRVWVCCAVIIIRIGNNRNFAMLKFERKLMRKEVISQCTHCLLDFSSRRLPFGRKFRIRMRIEISYFARFLCWFTADNISKQQQKTCMVCDQS